MKTHQKIKADWGVIIPTQMDCYILCAAMNAKTRCVLIEDLAILSTMQAQKLWSIKHWATTVPLHACIVKPVSLPTEDVNEALQMLEFELPTLIPLSTSEMVYGCTRINKPRDGMIHLLVYILRQSVLKERLKPIQEAGIVCQYVLLDTLAAYHGLTLIPDYSKADMTTLIGPDEGVVILSQNQSVCAIERLAWSTLESLPSQINSIIQSHIEASNLKGEYAHFIGSMNQGTNNHIKLFIDNASQVSEIVLHQGMTGASWQTDSTCHPSDAYGEIRAMGLLDTVTHDTWPHANLLPKDDIHKFHTLSQRKTLLTFAGFLLLISLQLHGLLYVLNNRISRQCASIEAQISPIASIANDVDSKRQQLNAIAGQFNHRGMIRKIYNELCEFTPKTITLSSLTIESLGEKGTSISLQGQAESSLDAMEYLANANNLKALSPDQTGRINAIGKSNLFEFQSQGIIHAFKESPLSKEVL